MGDSKKTADGSRSRSDNEIPDCGKGSGNPQPFSFLEIGPRLESKLRKSFMANILQIFLSRPSKAYLGIFVDKTKLDNFNPFTAKVGSKLACAECQAQIQH